MNMRSNMPRLMPIQTLAYSTVFSGRRYHAFRKGTYIMPNDGAEQDRLDLHHHIFRLCLDGSLLAGPIPDNVERVLDVGTGTGIVSQLLG